MRRKIILNSPRIQELKRRKRQTVLKKLSWVVFFFLLVLVGLSFLSRWSKLNIDKIEVTGNKIVETKIIEDFIQQELAGNYFWIFPKTNFILFPQNRIENELKNKFKRIETISVNDKNIKTLEVSISERNALYTWCGVEPLIVEDSDQKCYFLDKEGYLFDEAPYFSGDVYFRFYGVNDIDTENPLGNYFFKQHFNRLIHLKDLLEKTELRAIAFYVMENGDIKILLKKQGEMTENPNVILKTESDFDKIIENLQSVLNTEPLQSDFKNKYSSLMYIDLRFGNKVYYKFK
ncbi:MAG: FtsQ-type POTRA domain-containing protein [Burkholderiales bacterium]|nr:FtsQ-type POTRA domain-containing protein [Burkholderiales bacterium]